MPTSKSRQLIVSLSLVIFLFAALGIASAQVEFTSAYYDSPDIATQSIVNGDFNNDGILDLVSINAQSLSFYKGLGGGKFASAVDQTFPAYAGQAAAADFNNDGKLDLAVCGCGELGNQILIYFGNGNGTFTAGPSLVTSNVPLAIALADFNGDHIPDVAVSECSSSTSACSVEVFLGQGNGTFKRSATLSYGGGKVVAGDFNADGHQDLAVLAGETASSELTMFLGNGNGTFQSPKLASFTCPVSLTVGDFYNDRIQSLAILSPCGNSSNYVTPARYSNGELEVGASQLVNVSGNYLYITSGDFNGDFLDDVAVVGSGTEVPNPAAAYMLGEGNGSFHSAVSIWATGQSEITPFIRDLNLDSRHDLGGAWTDSDSRYGTGGGAFVMLNTNGTTNCAPPPANKLGVDICAPSNGQTVGSSFAFRAAGNAFNGIAKRMELWIDGKKIGQDLEDQLRITTTLTSGKHTASFVVVDSFDNYTSSSVTFNAN